MPTLGMILLKPNCDKLSAPAGRPGSRLVPGQGKPVKREKAENKEYRRGRRQKDGGRKRGAEGLVSRQPSIEGSREPTADWPRQVSKEEKD